MILSASLAEARRTSPRQCTAPTKQAKVAKLAKAKAAVERYGQFLEQCKRQTEGIVSRTATSALGKHAEFAAVAGGHWRQWPWSSQSIAPSSTSKGMQRKKATMRTRQAEVKRRQKDYRAFADCPKALLRYAPSGGGIVPLAKDEVRGRELDVQQQRLDKLSAGAGGQRLQRG